MLSPFFSMAETDQTIADLETLSTDVCGARHHFRWRHGGQELPVCPQSVCQTTLFCCHHFGQVPALHRGIDDALQTGKIREDQATALRALLRKSGSELFTHCDTPVVALTNILEMYKSDPHSITLDMRQHHERCFRYPGITVPFEELTPQIIEDFAQEKMQQFGRPIAELRALLVSLLRLPDGGTGAAQVDEFLGQKP